VVLLLLPGNLKDDETGGGVDNCQSQLDSFAPNGAPECVGAPSGLTDIEGWAIRGLNDGWCSAIWGTAPSIADSPDYTAFPQPKKDTRVAFFRTTDFVAETADNGGGGTDGTDGAVDVVNPADCPVVSPDTRCVDLYQPVQCQFDTNSTTAPSMCTYSNLCWSESVGFESGMCVLATASGAAAATTATTAAALVAATATLVVGSMWM